MSSKSEKKKGKAATVCKGDLSDDDMELVEKALDLPIGVSNAKSKAKKKPAAAKAVAKKKAGGPTNKGSKDKGGCTASSKKKYKSKKGNQKKQREWEEENNFQAQGHFCSLPYCQKKSSSARTIS